MFIKKGKWNWPILKILTGKEPITLNFIVKILIFGIGFKLLIINGIGVLFFGIEPFPILNFLTE